MIGVEFWFVGIRLWIGVWLKRFGKLKFGVGREGCCVGVGGVGLGMLVV